MDRRVLPGMTTRENVMLGRMFGGDPTGPPPPRSEADALLERVGLADRAHLIGAQLTYIDQKRVELARALATRPQLLLLDEWLAGLNPTELKIGIDLIHQIQREGVTVLMVEHVMEAIRALCGHVVVMNAGVKIAEGTARRGAVRPESDAGLSWGRRCCGLSTSASPTANTKRCTTSPSISRQAAPRRFSAPMAPARARF